jgi:proteasome accessory factor B
VADETPVEVRLLFHDAPTAQRARENRWHPSQQAIERPDGRLELRFVVGGLLEITPWVLSWGEAVEVLAPPELRSRVAATARAQLNRYTGPTVGAR